MSKFNKWINEILSKTNKNVEIETNDSSQFIATFVVDKNEYTFVADHVDYAGLWEISFWLDNGDSSSTSKMTKSLPISQVSEVFSKVFYCIEALIGMQQPRTIELTASKSEPSRIKLYQRIINNSKLKHIIGNFTVERQELSADVKFVLKRY